jgi:hypothetical protein
VSGRGLGKGEVKCEVEKKKEWKEEVEINELKSDVGSLKSPSTMSGEPSSGN